MTSESLVASAFSAFDAYTYVILVLISIGAAFTMRSMGSIVTATIAALVVFATAIFLRGLVSTGFTSSATVSMVHDYWAALLTLQFAMLCVYALVSGTIIAASYGVLLLVRG
ncbi:MAG TPA: hypothetical protein VGK90_01035 [Rhizomicrobium sp.]|jgi:hypothetical protein